MHASTLYEPRLNCTYYGATCNLRPSDSNFLWWGIWIQIRFIIPPLHSSSCLDTRSPVAIVYTRQESMQSTTKRHPSDIEIKIGCDPCGKISALKFEGNFNTGAYASWGPTVANRVPVHASGPYKIPNYTAKSRAIHTLSLIHI